MSEGRRKPIEERFDAAVEVIKSLPQEGPFQPSNTVKLRFYALYKQVKEGPCNKPKPSFWDAVGRAKWEAWSVCGKMSKELAMQMYVEELQQVVETMPQTPEVEQFLRSIGPFYEEVSDPATSAKAVDQLRGEGVAKEESEKAEASMGGGGGGGEEETGRREGGGEFSKAVDEASLGGGGFSEGGGDKDEVDVVSEGSEVVLDEAGTGGEGGGGGGAVGEEASLSLERAESSEDLSQSDGENSDVFQESFQDFAVPPSSITAATHPSQNGRLAGSTQHKKQSDSIVSHREFITPRNSQASSVSHVISPRHNVNSAHHHMDSLSEVMSQVNAIQSKLQEILHQLSDLSSSTATRQTPPNIQHCDQCSSRRNWLFLVSPILLSWPIIVKYLVAYLTRRFGKSSFTPEWVWSLVTFFHTAYSVALLVFLSHQTRA